MKGDGQVDCKPEILSECPVEDVCVTTFEHKMEKLLVPHFDSLGKLKWTGNNSQWVDVGAKRVAFDPTVNEEGPTALLFREDLMRRYLNDSGLTLCWIMRGEKNLFNKSSFVSQLRVFGTYVLEAKDPKGKLAFTYIPQ